MTLMCAVAILAPILHPTNFGPVLVPELTVPLHNPDLRRVKVSSLAVLALDCYDFCKNLQKSFDPSCKRADTTSCGLL
eukprot:9287720-Karenia_brevis.AAC.1